MNVCSVSKRQLSTENHPLIPNDCDDYDCYNNEVIKIGSPKPSVYNQNRIQNAAYVASKPITSDTNNKGSTTLTSVSINGNGSSIYESIIEQLACRLSMNTVLKNMILSPFKTCSHQRRSRSWNRSRNESRERKLFGDDNDCCSNNKQHSRKSRDEIEMNQFTGFQAMTKSHGHKFEYVVMNKATWCDKCGRFILRYYQHCYQCAFCLYTCHVTCKNVVTLKCPSAHINNFIVHGRKTKLETTLSSRPKLSITSYNEDIYDAATYSNVNTCKDGNNVKITTNKIMDFEEKIKKFNESNKQGLVFKLAPTSMQGSIRVHMNLFRPITMLVSTPPPSLQSDDVSQSRAYKTSFHMPKDTSKLIYINDNTTSLEVVELLLKKFCIAESPKRFSLYHKTTIHDNVHTMRKLNEHDLPLVLCLHWFYQGPEALDSNKFILQETDAGDIKWDIFSTPELENFLCMLNREEREHEERIRDKNKMMKLHIKRRLKEIIKENNLKATNSGSSGFISGVSSCNSIEACEVFDAKYKTQSCTNVLNYL